MGEYCSNAPCKWLPDLGKGGAHGTNAHNMFDGIPSQPEMSKEATWELGDRKDMDQAPNIVTKDLPKVTPTKCSTLCSSSDIKPDLIVDVHPSCSKEMHTKCSTLGLDIKGDSNQVVLAFQTMMGISKVVPSSVQPVENFSSRTVTDIKLDTPMLNTCSLKCLSSDKRPLMEHTERNP
ncbi:hypothetical protein OsI_26716 [Oryza sativa Indica Group]|uniref:Uncharacterized protein n=1 Tax=Oryza sativa subsp. indica TaxID=39946 RepID=A2YNA2_ORYSI|nr:hypothetical protein OsI_26716 [Oryza sativa Indica Group]